MPEKWPGRFSEATRMPFGRVVRESSSTGSWWALDAACIYGSADLGPQTIGDAE